MTVVFGGIRTNGTSAYTWGWDGVTWRVLATVGPPARSGHALAYDPVRQVVVLDVHDPGVCLTLFKANRETGLAVAAAILVGWLLISLIAQFPFGARRIKGVWNYFIPHWSLFTAPLIYLDVKLCYRHEITPANFTPWQPLPFPARPWFERMWQPERRLGKLVGDAASQLVKLRLSGERG